ncbi:hypothetical protein ACK3TF_004186 [Chlorella vulgaris]
MAESTSAGPTKAQAEPKTKEEALAACVEQHAALIDCFKTCNFVSSFTGCCNEEHKVFWECYTAERGTNQTRITSWLNDYFGDKPKQPPAQEQQQQQQQQQQDRRL